MIPTAIPLIIVIIAFSLNSCSPYTAYLREIHKTHPTRTIAHWGHSWKEKPLIERIRAAPESLLEKIRIENRLNGFTEIPMPAEPAAEFYESIKRINIILPEKLRYLSEERIIGIFIVNDLGGTGYCETVLDDKGRERFAVIVLDRGALMKRKANEWATWKENSVFKSVPGTDVALKVVIENSENDDITSAIEYILLHEIGHILGMASNAHPSWNSSKIISDTYPFTRLSWEMTEDKIESRFDGHFPERKSIRAYTFEKSALNLSQAKEVYKKLFIQTNFPTIHASASLWEDFAESFVNYLHVVQEKKPYSVYLKIKGMPEKAFYSCWNNNICNSKKEFFKKWCENPMLSKQ